jgi:myo-inositol-1-phosphate synthase
MEIKKTKHIAYRTIKGQAYIINTKTSTLHELDETGTFLWELIDKCRSQEILTKKLFDNYAVDSLEQAETDVKSFIYDLLRKGLVEKS